MANQVDSAAPYVLPQEVPQGHRASLNPVARSVVERKNGSHPAPAQIAGEREEG
jgi:hypothetical protein